ncbi:MAG: hypothetical protein JNK37_12955 [Verrucomicrobiales bacterium]|nr:hypothetical protein [Verrucomicrobiales bacterium]
MSEPLSEPHRLSDFPDRISPMLVKELRQGLRTNLFTVAFVLLQGFMVLCVLIGATAPGDNASSGFFWFFAVVALVVVMPIRGFGALTSEIQQNTMDLMHLTEMGAWRIVFGKWAAIVAQTLLLVCGILPYLVMRYFFGGIDLFRELIALFWVLVLSMTLTAVTVGFSAFRSVLLRFTVLGGLVILSMMGMEAAEKALQIIADPTGATAPRSIVIWTVVSFFFSAVYLSWFMLDLGASRIAPEAENHATRKRVIALLFGGGALLLPLAGLDVTACLLLTTVVWSLVCLDALTERPVMLPSIYLPFARRWYLRPWTLLVVPGWHSGILFYLFCAGLFTLGAWLLPPVLGTRAMEVKEWQFLVSGLSIIVFPLLIIHLFIRWPMTTATLFGFYLLIQVCSGVLALFLTIMAEESPVKEVAYLIAPIPTTALFAAIANDASPSMTGLAGAFGLAAVLITLFRAAPYYRDAFRLVRALR